MVVKIPTKRRGCFCNGGRNVATRRHRCLVLVDTDEELTHPMLPEAAVAQVAVALPLRGATVEPQARARTHVAPAVDRLLILQLGATNDASGTPDPDVLARCPVTVALYQAAVAAGRAVTVLASGGEYSAAAQAFSFNPTATPHAEIVEVALLAAGLPEAALGRPGLPAMHTVHEALLCREYIARGNADGVAAHHPTPCLRLRLRLSLSLKPHSHPTEMIPPQAPSPPSRSLWSLRPTIMPRVPSTCSESFSDHTQVRRGANASLP